MKPIYLKKRYYLDGGAFLDELMGDVLDFPKAVWDEIVDILGNLGIYSKKGEICDNPDKGKCWIRCYRARFDYVPKGKYLWLFRGTVKQYYQNSCQFRLEDYITLKGPEKLPKNGKHVNLVVGYIEIGEPGYLEFTYQSHFRKPMKVKTISLLAVDEFLGQKNGA